MPDAPANIRSGPWRLAVLAPTFNNASTLTDVLAAVHAPGVSVIVVNDGSTDETSSLLSRWHDPALGRVVVTHARNRGKAAALQSGFATARRMGFTHVATIDTDGQHDPKDLVALCALAADHPGVIVVGVRSLDADNYPTRSRVGRRVSNLLVQLLGGVRVEDSQCGLRVYPLDVLGLLDARAGRYAFETEVLIRAGWANVQVIEAPIRCIYFDRDDRVSHFKPWRDSISASWMHMKLIARALWPLPQRKWTPTGVHTRTGTIIERGLRWMNPLPTLRSLRRSRLEREKFARSAGVGAFFALLPPMGFKTVACLALSRALSLQPTIALAVSSLQTPPLGIPLAILSIHTGHLLLTGHLADSGTLDTNEGLSRMVGFLAACWTLGGTVSGTIIGLATYLLVRGRSRSVSDATSAAARSAIPSPVDTP